LGILRRSVSSSNSSSAEKILFFETPPIRMCNDNVHGWGVSPPYFFAIQDMRLKKLLGVLEEITHEVNINFHEGDAPWEGCQITYISGQLDNSEIDSNLRPSGCAVVSLYLGVDAT
jgi:hypothetical protein